MPQTEPTSVDDAPIRTARPARHLSTVARSLVGDALVVGGVVAWGAVLAASRDVASWALGGLVVGSLVPAGWALWRESRTAHRGRRRLALYAGLAFALVLWAIGRIVWQAVVPE